jgi:hypothetical protein
MVNTTDGQFAWKSVSLPTQGGTNVQKSGLPFIRGYRLRDCVQHAPETPLTSPAEYRPIEVTRKICEGSVPLVILQRRECDHSWAIPGAENLH